MKIIHEEAPEAVKELDVEAYTGRVVAIDASMALYQFLIAIRSAGDSGGPASVLTNADGEQTSHIQGMFNRTIRLLSAGMKPIYVFDGKPPKMKGGELSKRTARRAEAEAKLREAREAGDVAAIEKAEGALVKVSRKDADDVKVLLKLMGVPVVDAVMEAEAQCAELVKSGKAHAAGTEDMDALTFGTPVQLRRLTFSAKGKEQKIVEIKHDKVLDGLGLTQEQFVDFCILCGCDYTTTIRGIGPKTALKLIKQFGSIENILASWKSAKDRAKIPDAWLNSEERAKRKAQRRKEALMLSSKVNMGGAAAVGNIDSHAEFAIKDDVHDEAANADYGAEEPIGNAGMANAEATKNDIDTAKVGDSTAGAENGVATDSSDNRAENPTNEPTFSSEAEMQRDKDPSEEIVKVSTHARALTEDACVQLDNNECEGAPEQPTGEVLGNVHRTTDTHPGREDEDHDDESSLPEFVGARELFMHHEIMPAAEVEIKWTPPDETGLRTYLIEKMGFNADRVDGAIKKLTVAQGARKQQRMESFFKVLPKPPLSEAMAKKRAFDKKAKADAAKKLKKAKKK